MRTLPERRRPDKWYGDHRQWHSWGTDRRADTDTGSAGDTDARSERNRQWVS
jgi:hypothetical protein